MGKAVGRVPKWHMGHLREVLFFSRALYPMMTQIDPGPEHWTIQDAKKREDIIYSVIHGTLILLNLMACDSLIVSWILDP